MNTDKIELKAILHELRSVRSEIATLNEKVEQLEGLLAPPAPVQTHEPERFRVFITRSGKERKPFALRLDGSVEYVKLLSSIRTAVFLALLTDLEDRLEGGDGAREPIEWIVRAMEVLEPERNGDELLAESARVALYRFDQFCQSENYFAGNNLRLFFNSSSNRFELQAQDGSPLRHRVNLEVETDDAAVESFLSQAFKNSPLARVKKRKALFVPAGRNGYERLVLEMFDHEHPFTITTIYFRLATISYPDRLLNFIGASDNLKKRRRLAVEGFQSGRFNFFEIISLETFWSIIRQEPSGGFRLYPRNVPVELIEEQLVLLKQQVELYQSYHLILTGAPLAFFLGTCEIETPTATEYYTFFPRLGGSDYTRDVSCFALSDPVVNENVNANIIDWLIRHPLTISDRVDVIRFINAALERLRGEGPLVGEEEPPVLESSLSEE